MLFKTLAIAALTSLAVADDKACGPCCGNCPDRNAYPSILNLQSQVEADLASYNVAGFNALLSSQFTYSLIGTHCLETPGYCVENGTDYINMYFAAGDDVWFYAPTEEFIQRLNNGTIIVTKLQVINPVAVPSVIINRMVRFHYNPIALGSCSYQLDYIDGNLLTAGTYIEGLALCPDC